VSIKVDRNYGNWTVTGPPQPYIYVSQLHGNTVHRKAWKVPCQCKCGRISMVNYQNLRRGLSTQCVACAKTRTGQIIAQRHIKAAKRLTAFGETKTLREWADDPRCTCVSVTTLYNRGAKFDSHEKIISWDGIGSQRKLTDAQIKEIYSRNGTGEAGRSLAKEFGISESLVSRIRNGTRHADITGAGDRAL